MVLTSALALATPPLLLGLLKKWMGKPSNPRPRSWAIQLQGAEPEAVARSDFDLVIIDYSRDCWSSGEYSPKEVELMRSGGVVPVAYLSIGEAEVHHPLEELGVWLPPPAGETP